MNYEKRYKNLVRAIKQLQETNPSDECIQNWVNDTLYGTKENENEKNIKDLIDELKCSLRAANCQNEVCNGGHEKRIALLEWAIAWVEKQDSYYTFEIKKGHWYKCVCDYMLNGSDLMFKNGRLYYCRCDWRLGGEIDERNVKDIGVHGYKSFFRPATNQEIKDWLEKQVEQTISENYKQAEKEKRDVVGRGFMLCNGDILDFKEGESYWLEYIGDDKYNVRSDNLLGKTYHLTPMQFYLCFRPLTWLEKQGEQKPADKVQPKFKVGDWIVSDYNNVAYIESIGETKYNLQCKDGYHEKMSIEYIDRCWHLWSIEDAKDGDVLFVKPTKNLGKQLIMFGGINSDNRIKYYCRFLNNKFSYDDGLMGYDHKYFLPATKKQCDLLYQKIHDAGYEWDAKKKELKKIEKQAPKPKWSYEDEANLNNIIWLCNNCLNGAETTWIPSQAEKIKHLIEKIKERGITQQSKWSDEDEELLQHCCGAIATANYYIEGKEEMENWLKSIKKRMEE